MSAEKVLPRIRLFKKMADNNGVLILFESGRVMIWDKTKPKQLRERDGSWSDDVWVYHPQNSTHYQAFAAWRKIGYDRRQLKNVCCAFRRRVPCVCVQSYDCLVHGQVHEGTHD